MTDRPDILKSDRLREAAERARQANPNRDLIEQLRTELGAISAQISTLVTEDEKAANLMQAIFAGDDERLAASFMSGRELATHLGDLIDYDTETLMSQAILSEVFQRLDPEHGTREEP